MFISVYAFSLFFQAWIKIKRKEKGGGDLHEHMDTVTKAASVRIQPKATSYQLQHLICSPVCLWFSMKFDKRCWECYCKK